MNEASALTSTPNGRIRPNDGRFRLARPWLALLAVPALFLPFAASPLVAQTGARATGETNADAGEARDPSELTNEALRRLCREEIEAAAKAFELEMAEYSRKFSNNPPQSVAVRASMDSLVARGQIAVGFLLDALASDIDNLSANSAATLVRMAEANALGSAARDVYDRASKLLSTSTSDAVRSRTIHVMTKTAPSPERVGADLHTQLKKETVERIAAQLIDAIGRVGYEGAVPTLTEALADPRFNVRKEAVEALGAIGAEGSVSRIAGALEDESHEVRRSAYAALGATGDPAAASKIEARLIALSKNITATSTRNDAALQEAKWGLAAIQTIRSPRSLETLQSLLIVENWDFSNHVKSATEAILDGIIADPPNASVLPSVFGILRHEPLVMSLAERAIDAVVAIRDESSLPVLHELLSSRDTNLASLAAEALSEIGNRESVSALRDRYRALKSRDVGSEFNLRRNIAKALARLGDYSGTHMDDLTRAYKQRINKNRDDAGANLALGDLYLDINMPKQATKYYERATQLLNTRKRKAETFFNLALCHALVGDKRRSDEALEEAFNFGYELSAATLANPSVRRLERSDQEAAKAMHDELSARINAAAPAGTGG